MKVHTDKTQGNKSRSAPNNLSQTQGGDGPSIQFSDNRPETVMQGKLQEIVNNGVQAKQTAQLSAILNPPDVQPPIQKKENNTGLPDNLKSGIEDLSGYAMDDVKVHYNSSQPNALAYVQGADTHVAPGQERHLPHEAWHVVQQKQGRVRPTMQAKGVAINDGKGLKEEANVMVGEALQMVSGEKARSEPITVTPVTQLQLATGQYRLKNKFFNTNLRNNDQTKTVRAKLGPGTEVMVIDNGGKTSDFKAGWIKNEHSWVQTNSHGEGWIEDSMLEIFNRPTNHPGLYSPNVDVLNFDIPGFSNENNCPRPEAPVNVSSGWDKEELVLNNLYPVYSRWVDTEIQIVATNEQKEKVVASSYAHVKDDKWIKDFSSYPPFAGLGRIVIEKLRTKYNETLEPEAPSAGAFHAYQSMGALHLSYINEESKISIQKRIGELVRQAKEIKNGKGFSLESEEGRKRLTEVQEEIKKYESSLIMNKKFWREIK